MFEVHYGGVINGEMEANGDIAAGVCVDMSANKQVEPNVTIGDRTYAVNTRDVEDGELCRLVYGSGATFSTDQVEGTPSAGDDLVAHTDGLLKTVVTPATDFIVAKCISFADGILEAILV
jgi:hypothetical protein